MGTSLHDISAQNELLTRIPFVQGQLKPRTENWGSLTLKSFGKANERGKSEEKVQKVGQSLCQLYI